MNLKDIKKKFPLLINNPEIVYLDSAATTQKPQQVIDSEINYYSNFNANVYRGVYELSQSATDLYEQARMKVQKFINAEFAQEVIFTSGTTQSINMLSRSFENEIIFEGDEILVTDLEHHSNLVPWQELAKRTGATLSYVKANDEYIISPAELESCINNRTKILSITHMSNVLGTLNPIKELIKIAHKHNLLVVIDGAQAVSHVKVDVQELNADFYVFSGHKVFGPTGIGVLYGKKSLLNNLQPANFGGEMISLVNDFDSTWADLPNKFEAGTPNIVGAVGLGTAVDFLNLLDTNELKKNEDELIQHLLNNLQNIHGVKVYGSAEARKHNGIVSFNVDGIHPHDVATVLDTQNICIRAGHHCAQPLMRMLNENSVCRVSLSIYNDREDIDKLIDSIIYAKEFFKID